MGRVRLKQFHLTGYHCIANAMKVGYFKDECKWYPIVKFNGLRLMFNFLTLINAEEYHTRLPVDPVQLKHKAVAKGVSLANINGFTHDEYFTMLLVNDACKVTNRRVRSILHLLNNKNYETVHYGDDDIFHNIEQSCRYARWSKWCAVLVVWRQAIFKPICLITHRTQVVIYTATLKWLSKWAYK